MSPQPQSMDDTTGQETNCPTNTAMLFVIFFLRRKKIFIGKREFCIVLMKTSKESHRRTFPKKGNVKEVACGRFFNNKTSLEIACLKRQQPSYDASAL